jgi:hypothetical protein
MNKNHKEFIAHLNQFKHMLVETNQQNLKYLQCRLDFNEYYQIQEQKAANMA